MANGDSQSWVENLEEDVKRILKDSPEYEKLLGVFKEMLIAQREARDKLPAVEVGLDAGKVAEFANAGVALLGKIEAGLDADAAAELFEKLKGIAAGHGDEFGEEAGKIDGVIEAGRLDLKGLLEEVFAGGSAEDLKKKAMDLELDPHFFALLVFSSVRPSLELYAEKLRPMIDDKDLEKRLCPVCGRLPYISLLEGEEGRRALCCPACSTTWRFPRLRCVNCGEEDHEKLRMLYPESGSRERYADVCDECKRYLKVIDSRKLARAPVMMIVDAATLHIDMLAQREGFVTL